MGDIWWYRRLKSPPSAQFFYEPKIHLKKSFSKSKIKGEKKDKEKGEGKIKLLKLSHIFKNVLSGSSGLCSGVWKSFSCVWTLCNSLQPHGLSMEFSRPEYWSWKPFPSPGDLPNPGIEPRSPALQADSLPAEPQGKSSAQEIFVISIRPISFLSCLSLLCGSLLHLTLISC